MADVSKIKLPNGTTYNIKDTASGYTTNIGTITKIQTTAGAHTTINVSSGAAAFNVPTKTSHLTNDSGFITNAGVTGVKGDKETNYRTGNVNITPHQIGAAYGINENLSAFAPEISYRIQIDRLENAFYFADKRWTVTATKTDVNGVSTALNATEISRFFDMMETCTRNVPAGGKLVVTIDFSNSPNGVFPNYPYGMVCLGFYYNDAPQSVSARVYGKHTGTESYWANLTCWADPRNTTGKYRWLISQQSMYNMEKLEITINAQNDVIGSLHEISYYLTREDKSHDMPYVSKLRAETLYYTLTAPNFIGNLTGNVTGNVSGSAGSVAWSGVGSKPTTLSGYGITDAKIASGTITLGSNTITPLTSSSTLNAAKLSGAIPSAVTATTQASTDNSTKIATTAYVTTAIANLPEPMVFKGSVGTGGTITSLPSAAASNEGHTYKVITALSSPSAKVGDTVISNGSSWVVIPSGDEPSGTVTSVAVSNGGGLSVSGSPVTSSGTITISHADTSSQASSSNSGRTYIQSLTLDTYGHVTGISTATETVTNTDNKLQVAEVTSGTPYYPIVGTGTAAATRQYDTTGFLYSSSTGTTNVIGSSTIILGNNTNSGVANNKQGVLCLYGTGTHGACIVAGALTAARTLTLPDANGTVALTSDIPDVSGKIDTAGTGLSKSGTTLNHSNAVAAQSTQAIYPIKIDAQGHISAYGSAVTIPTVPSNIVNTITTTAGAHTAITSQKGNVSFNVPTTAAHVGAASSSHAHGNITNGGDITATAPTVASGDQIIINDHSASKITNGPTFDGSTTTKALTPKGTWETFASSDKQLEITELTDNDSGISYYPIVGRGNTSAIRQYDEAGFCYIPQEGTTANDGYATLILGNNITSGTAGNRQGELKLFDSTNYCGTLSTTSNHLTDIRHWYLPDKTGTIALVSDITAAISYPVTSVNSKTGAVSLTASDVGAVPTTRTVNSKALSSNISLTASDVGAVPTTRTVNSKALSSDITLSASDIGAQAILVSGSNIKTINDISLLGSGDVWEALFNIVHPIYSFFETTDATFDPNTATGWYGTWELETEGLVHIGAGSTYTVGNTGGNKDAIIPYHRHSYTAPPSATDSHTLTASQIPAHTHGSETLVGHANFRKWTTGKLLTYTDGIFSSSEPATSATSVESSGSNPNKVDRLTITATHEHSSVGGGKGHTHTITGSSSNTGYAGASGNLTNANMQPYVVVNRWYRTA